MRMDRLARCVKQVAVSACSTYFLLGSGEVWMIGQALADGQMVGADRLEPTHVKALNGVQIDSMVATSYALCVLTRKGDVLQQGLGSRAFTRVQIRPQRSDALQLTGVRRAGGRIKVVKIAASEVFDQTGLAQSGSSRVEQSRRVMALSSSGCVFWWKHSIELAETGEARICKAQVHAVEGLARHHVVDIATAHGQSAVITKHGHLHTWGPLALAAGSEKSKSRPRRVMFQTLRQVSSVHLSSRHVVCTVAVRSPPPLDATVDEPGRVPSLRALCEDALSAQMTHDGVLAAFSWANHMGWLRLLDWLTIYIAWNMDIYAGELLRRMSEAELATLEAHLAEWYPWSVRRRLVDPSVGQDDSQAEVHVEEWLGGSIEEGHAEEDGFGGLDGLEEWDAEMPEVLESPSLLADFSPRIARPSPADSSSTRGSRINRESARRSVSVRQDSASPPCLGSEARDEEGGSEAQRSYLAQQLERELLRAWGHPVDSVGAREASGQPSATAGLAVEAVSSLFFRLLCHFASS